MPNSYDFDERMRMSDGVSVGADFSVILRTNLVDVVRVERASQTDDRNGTDWWAITNSGRRLSIDCKVRGTDFALKGKDDLALETWSVVEKRIPGWTRNPDKRTDFILWRWSSGRWCMVPFPMLCRVFTEYWEVWRNEFQRAVQHTPRGNGVGYHSECVYVPRRLVWSEIYRRFAGQPVREVPPHIPADPVPDIFHSDERGQTYLWPIIQSSPCPPAALPVR